MDNTTFTQGIRLKLDGKLAKTLCHVDTQCQLVGRLSDVVGIEYDPHCCQYTAEQLFRIGLTYSANGRLFVKRNEPQFFSRGLQSSSLYAAVDGWRHYHIRNSISIKCLMIVDRIETVEKSDE